MDLSHTHSQQAISSSLSPPTELSSTTQPSLQIHTTPQDSPRTLRSATRARAVKQKVAKDTDIPDQITSAPAESSSRQTRSNYHPYPSKRSRDTKGKGKSQETTEEQTVPRTSKKYVEPAELQNSSFDSLTMFFYYTEAAVRHTPSLLPPLPSTNPLATLRARNVPPQKLSPKNFPLVLLRDPPSVPVQPQPLTRFVPVQTPPNLQDPTCRKN
jgi:hypothetical protein